jgi:hypothetical protein
MLSTGLVAKPRFTELDFSANPIVAGLRKTFKSTANGLLWRLLSCIGTEYVHRE